MNLVGTPRWVENFANVGAAHAGFGREFEPWKLGYLAKVVAAKVQLSPLKNRVDKRKRRSQLSPRLKSRSDLPVLS